MQTLILRTLAVIFLFLIFGYSGIAQNTDKPLILPMATDGSPSTWLLGQPYGNTVGAYRNADRWYSAGQGLHFGLDFVMPCGTPIVAVADGEVTFVDDFGFGSRPHNVIIQHPQLGFSSLYGHLFTKSNIPQNTWVTQGQVIGMSGDPDETCSSRPHLHYELRSLDYRTAINPVPYTDANWHTLTSIGGFGSPLFEQNLDNARFWLNVDDQPNVAFGGARLNNYAMSYSANVPPQYYASPPPARSLPILRENIQVSLTPLGFDFCCQRYWWSKTDADKFYVVDGGVNQRAAVYEWSVSSASPTDNLSPLPIPITSPDGAYEVVLIEERAYLKRLSDGELLPTPVINQIPAVSPNNLNLMWVEREETTAFTDRPQTHIYVSNFDGTNASLILSELSASAMWLDDHRLLISTRENRTLSLSIWHGIDGSLTPIGTWENLRGLSVAPGGTRLMFYLVNQPDASLDGMYMMETQGTITPQKLDWFGAFRWRDSDSVYYIPFDTSTDTHQLMYYHFPTATHVQLTNPETTPFTIMNGDWSVSPDGQHILFHNVINRNLWVLNVNG